MTPRILLTGAAGQLGSELRSTLTPLGEIVALSRAQLDLADPVAIRHTVQSLRPQLVVNAGAYTAVDQAEREAALAHAVNGIAPAILAEECAASGAALVHYSTDYVFDGAKGSPYEEDEATAPLNEYGRSKLAGEQALAASDVPYLIFRSAWIYSARGKNFLLTILRLAGEGEELRIVADQVGAPTSARALAQATADVLRNIAKGSQSFAEAIRPVRGIYHATAAGQTSWHGFAENIVALCREKPETASALGFGPPRVRKVAAISTSEYPTPAQRPRYSVLSNARLQKTFNVHLPHWEAQLPEVLAGVTAGASEAARR